MFHHWPNEKISLASWAIDLLSSKHFCCKKLHLHVPQYSPGQIFTFWGEDTLISLNKFANISFVLKFMQLVIPLLFYHFFLSHHIISTNFCSGPHPSLTLPSFRNWSHSVYNHVMFLILVNSNQIYVFTKCHKSLA